MKPIALGAEDLSQYQQDAMSGSTQGASVKGISIAGP